MGLFTNIAKMPLKMPVYLGKGALGTWKATPRGVKTFAGASAALGAITGFLAYEALTPRGKKFDPDEQPIAPVPPMLTPQDLQLQPAPSEIPSGPADGMDPNHFRNAVLAGRGQTLGQPTVNATQPAMSAIAPEQVKDMGAAAKTPAV
jgi:hypothetical protein